MVASQVMIRWTKTVDDRLCNTAAAPLVSVGNPLFVSELSNTLGMMGFQSINLSSTHKGKKSKNATFLSFGTSWNDGHLFATPAINTE